MTRETVFKSILHKHNIYGEDVEDVLSAVSDMFEFEAKYIKATAPYAVNTIREMEHVAHETWEIINDLDEELEYENMEVK